MQKLRQVYATIASAAALVIATAIATPAFAQKVVWNHNIFGPQRAVTAGMEAVRDFFAKESNGIVEIKISYGAALGPEKQIP